MATNRADMKNVNNWHWVDKNCLNWSRTYFETELKGVSAEANGVSVKTLEVTSVTGDVDVNQRKGKIITIFDVAIALKFEGTTADGTAVTGKIDIPEVAHDTDTDDYVFEVTIDGDSSAKQSVRDLIRKNLSTQLRKKLDQFAKDLIKTHGKDVQVETDFAKAPATPAAPSASTLSTFNTAPKQQAAAAAGSVNTTSWTDSIELATLASEIYDALLNPAKVQAWTRSKVVIEPKVGSQFSLFGGTVTGQIKELEEAKKIVQTWRLNTWPAGHFSTVTMEFNQGTNWTTVKFKQDGVPVGEEEITKVNWSNYYWTAIKQTFGYVALQSSVTSPLASTTTTTTSSSSKKAAGSTSDKKRRRVKKKNNGGGGGTSAGGIAAGAGVLLTAFVLGLWFSKR